MNGLEDALRVFASKMTGAEISEIPENLEEIVQYTADNMAASGTEAPEAPSVDTLGGATDTGKAVMKAADAAAARKAIGAGTSSFSGKYTDLSEKPTIPAAYTLPAAGTAIGGVKKAAAVAFTVDGATTATCAAAIKGIIDALKTSGAMA